MKLAVPRYLHNSMLNGRLRQALSKTEVQHRARANTKTRKTHAVTFWNIKKKGLSKVLHTPCHRHPRKYFKSAISHTRQSPDSTTRSRVCLHTRGVKKTERDFLGSRPEWTGALRSHKVQARPTRGITFQELCIAFGMLGQIHSGSRDGTGHGQLDIHGPFLR